MLNFAVALWKGEENTWSTVGVCVVLLHKEGPWVFPSNAVCCGVMGILHLATSAVESLNEATVAPCAPFV